MGKDSFSLRTKEIGILLIFFFFLWGEDPELQDGGPGKTGK